MGVFDKIQSIFKGSGGEAAPGFCKTKLDVNRRFELVRKAVSGTMSKFYVARERETGEMLGLKIGDRDKVETFESRFRGLKKPVEGAIAMRFNHPRIVKTIEYGQTIEQNVPYVLMEFLDGPGLQHLVHNRDPILEGKRLLLIRQMAEALDTVHKAEFIHRDVCPRNFICSKDATSLKLIDFGLTLPAERDFMQPGNRTGTPLYMAPEVIRRRWTDARLDVFSFGVTAYHVCTYELPWPVAETTGLAALAHDTHPAKEILEFRPTLNKTLAAAIMSCMNPDPEKRMPTIEQFLHAIREVEQDDE